MSLTRVAFRSVRSFSAAASEYMGHSDAHKAVGSKHKLGPQMYKVPEYLSGNKWSFYDNEQLLTKHRQPQPNPKVPDTPRATKPPAPGDPGSEKK